MDSAGIQHLLQECTGLNRDSRPEDKMRVLAALERIVTAESGDFTGQLLERHKATLIKEFKNLVFHAGTHAPASTSPTEAAQA